MLKRSDRAYFAINIRDDDSSNSHANDKHLLVVLAEKNSSSHCCKGHNYCVEVSLPHFYSTFNDEIDEQSERIEKSIIKRMYCYFLRNKLLLDLWADKAKQILDEFHQTTE